MHYHDKYGQRIKLIYKWPCSRQDTQL